MSERFRTLVAHPATTAGRSSENARWAASDDSRQRQGRREEPRAVLFAEHVHALVNELWMDAVEKIELHSFQFHEERRRYSFLAVSQFQGLNARTNAAKADTSSLKSLTLGHHRLRPLIGLTSRRLRSRVLG